MIRILLLEDEKPAAERMQHLLSELEPDAVVVAVLDSAEDAVAWAKAHPAPDLIISDVELSDGLCFHFFAEAKPRVPVIFATAFNQYAIRAFEAHAIDYLLKPVRREALEAALAKWKERTGLELPPRDYAQIGADLKTPATTSLPKQWLIRYGQKMQLITARDVAVYFSIEKATFAMLPSGKNLPMEESLVQVEQALDPGMFFQINRNAIVRRDAITSMERRSKGRLCLLLEASPELDEEMLTVSAGRAPDFRKWLEVG